jgi:hypothetical protein
MIRYDTGKKNDTLFPALGESVERNIITITCTSRSSRIKVGQRFKNSIKSTFVNTVWANLSAQRFFRAEMCQMAQSPSWASTTFIQTKTPEVFLFSLKQ